MENSNQEPPAQYWQTATQQQNEAEGRQNAAAYEPLASGNQAGQTPDVGNRDSRNSLPTMFVPSTDARSNLDPEQAHVNSDVTGSGQNSVSAVPTMFVPNMAAVSGMGESHAQINNDVNGEGQNSESTVPTMFVPNMGASINSDNQQAQNFHVESNQTLSSFNEATGETIQNSYPSEYPTQQQVNPAGINQYGNGPTTGQQTPGHFGYDDVAPTLDCTNLDFYQSGSFEHLLRKKPSGSSIDQTEISATTSTSDTSFDYFAASNYRVSSAKL